MGNDALKVVAKEPSEPLKMFVPGSTAGIHDPGDVIRHLCFVGATVGKRETLLDQVKGEQKPVLAEQVVVLCFITLFSDILFPGKERPGSGDLLASSCLCILCLKCCSAGHQDVTGLLQSPCLLHKAFFIQTALFILADFAD